ncbi:MAG: hypothetical protein VYA34_09935 [Myxococcota bacterium]|nr:hypothetical protein [Myxococcota bacterium]
MGDAKDLATNEITTVMTRFTLKLSAPGFVLTDAAWLCTYLQARNSLQRIGGLGHKVGLRA